MIVFPVKLIYPRQKPDRFGNLKEITARNQVELERLMHLGWRIKPEKVEE